MKMEGRYVNSGYIIYPKLRYFVGIYELHLVSDKMLLFMTKLHFLMP